MFLSISIIKYERIVRNYQPCAYHGFITVFCLSVRTWRQHLRIRGNHREADPSQNFNIFFIKVLYEDTLTCCQFYRYVSDHTKCLFNFLFVKLRCRSTNDLWDCSRDDWKNSVQLISISVVKM